MELELTESLLVEPTDATMKLLRGLRQLGVRIAVGDFGTGCCLQGYYFGQALPATELRLAAEPGQAA